MSLVSLSTTVQASRSSYFHPLPSENNQQDPPTKLGLRHRVIIFSAGCCVYGYRCRSTLVISPPCSANSVTPPSTVAERIAERIASCRASMVSPTLATWCAAIDAGKLDLDSRQPRVPRHQHQPRRSKAASTCNAPILLLPIQSPAPRYSVTGAQQPTCSSSVTSSTPNS
jgi:hypothetical protein